jgi:hypothetical protein
MPPLTEALEPETVIDISHESLMRVWERLTRWADEEALSAQRYRRLSETATEYAAGKANLLRDPELQLSLDWRAATNPNAAWASLYGGAFEAVMSFLTASEEERARERRVEEERQQRELAQAQALAAERARSARRLRVALAGAVVLMIIAVVAAGWALKQRGEAERLGNIALARQLAAQSGSLASTDLEAAALLAVEAVRRSHNLETDIALREATRRLAHERLRLHHDGPVRAVTISPDSRFMATASEGKDKTLRLFEVHTGKELWRQQLEGVPSAIAYSADGRSIATAGSDGVRLLDPASGNEQWGRRHDGAANGVMFSPDGRSVATASQDRTMRVFERATGTEVWRVENASAGMVAFSADGRWIVTAAETHVRVFDAATHQDVWNTRRCSGNWRQGRCRDARPRHREDHRASASRPPRHGAGLQRRWAQAGHGQPRLGSSVRRGEPRGDSSFQWSRPVCGNQHRWKSSRDRCWRDRTRVRYRRRTGTLARQFARGSELAEDQRRRTNAGRDGRQHGARVRRGERARGVEDNRCRSGGHGLVRRRGPGPDDRIGATGQASGRHHAPSPPRSGPDRRRLRSADAQPYRGGMETIPRSRVAAAYLPQPPVRRPGPIRVSFSFGSCGPLPRLVAASFVLGDTARSKGT